MICLLALLALPLAADLNPAEARPPAVRPAAIRRLTRYSARAMPSRAMTSSRLASQSSVSSESMSVTRWCAAGIASCEYIGIPRTREYDERRNAIAEF